MELNQYHVKLAKEASKSIPHIVYVSPELKIDKMEKNYVMTQKIVETNGENKTIDIIIEKTLKLVSALQEVKMCDKDEDYLKYTNAHKNACLRIAEAKISMLQLEFLFDTVDINKHYHNMIEYMGKIHE